MSRIVGDNKEYEKEPNKCNHIGTWSKQNVEGIKGFVYSCDKCGHCETREREII